MVDPIRQESRALFVSALRRTDRVLVTGAGGWFGSTLAALLHGSGHPAAFTTQHPRSVSYRLGAVQAWDWDWDSILDFAPTVVFDCAFVLPDNLDSMSLERYVQVNTMLTSRLLKLAQLECVRAVVSVSSGAAVHPGDAITADLDVFPYGHLKRRSELALLQLGQTVRAEVVLARAWSMSGGLVTRPERYAFSNLVMQALSGHMKVEAAHEVWRRFAGVDDFLAVALALTDRGGIFTDRGGILTDRAGVVLNSGGELIELSGLAHRITEALGTDATLRRPVPSGSPPDVYYSRDDSWPAACESVDFRPADLSEQIRVVGAALEVRR